MFFIISLLFSVMPISPKKTAMTDEKPNIVKLSDLSALPLFKGFDTTEMSNELSKIVGYCKHENYGVGDLICDETLVEGRMKLIVILSGCAGVVESYTEDDEDDVILALVMSGQCLGELQLLGDPFPTGIKLIGFSDTRTIEIDADFVEDLSNQGKARFFENLARSLGEKVEICNITQYLRNIGDVPKKLAHFLREIRKNRIWKTIAPLNNKKFDVNIYWNAHQLSQYLSTNPVSLKEALVDLLNTGAGGLKWFDQNLKPITKEQDITKLNNKGSSINFKTQFMITGVNANELTALENVHEPKEKEAS